MTIQISTKFRTCQLSAHASQPYFQHCKLPQFNLALKQCQEDPSGSSSGWTLENFDTPSPAPAPHKLSTFDWVGEKATELKAEAHQYLSDKNNRQIAIEGATIAVGLAASAILHVNLAKSSKLLEGLVGGHSEIASAVGTEFSALTGTTAIGVKETAFDKLILPVRNEHLNLHEPTFALSATRRFKPVSFSSAETLFDGGFTLPRNISARTIERVPPNLIKTRILPCPDEPEYDRIVAHRFNLRLDLAEENSIGIMHPRFRNGTKQMLMLKSPDRNLSLYGNNESGVGVLEYEHLPSVRPYFKHADSVVQIKTSGAGRGVGSGTLISADGLIATAAHVVPSDRKIMVDTIKGQFEAKVIVRELDEHVDRAAIQLIGVPEGVTFPVPPMTSAELAKGMRAATVGHPQGLSGRFASVGQYLKDMDYDSDGVKGIHPTFTLDSTMPGHSGGPIFDANGNFAVILTNRFTPLADGPLAHINRGMVTGDRIEDLLALLEESKQV